ncbi:MAG: alpha/beta hydrolase [Verrucomicrobiales bacterium]
MIFRFVAFAAILLASTPIHADISQYEIKPDVVYGHKLGMALTMDVIKPKTGANGAGVLFMVSGGWVSGWMPPESALTSDFARGLGFTQMLEKGFTLFLVRHGSSPRFKVPECVDDVRRAVRFVRHRAADWAVNPARLGVFGASAGGHLSLMLGTTADEGKANGKSEEEKTSNRVAAVVAIFPPSELKTFLESEDYRRNFPALQFDAADWKSVSPIEHVTPEDAPTLLLHGGKDTLVPEKHSREMLAALQKHGVETDLIFFPEAGHGFAGADRERTVAATVAWFEKYLAAGRTAKPAAAPDPNNPLVGEWTLEFKMGDETRDYTLKFQPDGAGVKGTLVSPRSGDHPVDSASLDDNKFKMRIKRNFDGTDVTIVYTGKLDNGALAGKVVAEGYEDRFSGEWSAKRK